MSFEVRLNDELNKAIALIKESDFMNAFNGGDNVKSLYEGYIRAAYHFVVNTSSFTPLAARRMDPKHLKIRKWILEHSAEEMGHELMAVKDLERLGHDREKIMSESAPIGVVMWASFFHYKVTIDDPFAAFGVLYFLEGLAESLAPQLLPNIMNALEGDEKKAITFLREHGELDADHLSEQKELLIKSNLTQQDQDTIIRVIGESAHVKKFLLNDILNQIG
jgi:pyrroloquinoline quinone (PQQ) biosynthesis protein C